MADKVKIDTTPAPNAPDYDTSNAAAQDSGSTESNSPYSLRNFNSPPAPATPWRQENEGKENLW